MFKRLFSRKFKKTGAKTGIGAGIGVLSLGTNLTAEAGGGGGGGGGGGVSNDRTQSAGYTTSAGGATGNSYSGGSSAGQSSSGYSGSGSSGTLGTGTVTNGYQSVTWSGVSQSSWEASMAANGANVTTHSATHSTADFGDGTSASWSGSTGGGGYSGSSTPFLKTWNGKKYEFDNDFLFGKPETSFDNYAAGLMAYKAGKTGGDSYLIKNQIKSEKGVLKFQIKEIEPEESFIDTFKLTAVDMPQHFHPITDGNLQDTYIFDTRKTVTLNNQVAKINFVKSKKVALMENGYNHLTPTANKGKDTTLEAGDSIVISLPVTSEIEGETFLLVDSYFRDWALGNQVPFSPGERIWMQTLKTVKTLPALSLALVIGLFGLFSKETNADVPRYSQTGYSGGGGGGFSQTGYSGGGGFTTYRSRSLVITAKVGEEVVYLQTLFPRYVQASQEVVKIPADLLKKALGSVIEVCITATKKHKVRSAFLFTGTLTDENVTYTELEMLSALKTNTDTDYATVLCQKNADFMHTIPADVINVSIKDAPHKEGFKRHYLLKADGFYTKMSKHTKDMLGDKWYARLDGESKKLLRNLRVYKS